MSTPEECNCDQSMALQFALSKERAKNTMLKDVLNLMLVRNKSGAPASDYVIAMAEDAANR